MHQVFVKLNTQENSVCPSKGPGKIPVEHLGKMLNIKMQRNFYTPKSWNSDAVGLSD